jgi:hypothetical protein
VHLLDEYIKREKEKQRIYNYSPHPQILATEKDKTTTTDATPNAEQV